MAAVPIAVILTVGEGGTFVSVVGAGLQTVRKNCRTTLNHHNIQPSQERASLTYRSPPDPHPPPQSLVDGAGNVVALVWRVESW